MTKTKSGFKGVRKKHNRWRAEISFNNKTIHLGVYDNILDAALAYDNAAKKYFGEYARLNLGVGS
jgi:hypothetical protein